MGGNIDELILENFYQKNNGKICNKIKAQCEVYQSDRLSRLEFVTFRFQLQVMKEKAG